MEHIVRNIIVCATAALVAGCGADSGPVTGTGPAGDTGASETPAVTDSGDAPADGDEPVAGDTVVDRSGDPLAGDEAGTDADTVTDSGAGADTPEPTITWHQDIAPIIVPNCTGCHQDGGIAPFSLTTYELVSQLAPLVVDAVESRRMPPWGALDTETCQPRLPWKHDLRLDDAEIQLIRDWYEADRPEGDPAEPIEPPASEYALEDPTRELTPSGPYTTAGIQDQFRCFVLDPGYTQDTWISGVHFIPGDPLVVHHVLLYLDGEAESEALKDGAADGGFDCFGGPGTSVPELVGAWAPGAFPAVLPDGVGVHAPAGSRLVMQVHYHPISAEPRTDLTTVQLRDTTEEPEYTGLSILVGNSPSPDSGGDGLVPDGDDAEFVIPAGAKGHTERMRFTIPLTYLGDASPGAFIHAVGTHMHYVGVDMEIRFSRAPREAVCPPGDVLPALACYTANCEDADDVEGCVAEQCVDELSALPEQCFACLLGYGDEPELCLDDPDFSHYGELPPQPDEECLVQTPAWNFEWQRWYVYDEPEITHLPFLGPLDVLDLRCTYDNSLDNPFVLKALQEQGLDAPIDVHLGDTTLDEMCLAVMVLIYKFPDE